MDARHLVDYASDAAFAIDDQQRIVAWNDGARRLLEYTGCEVLGRPCWEVCQAVYPDGEPLCVPGCQGAQCFQQSRAFAAPLCHMRHKCGRSLPVNVESVVIPRCAQSSVAGSAVAIVFLRDKSEKNYQLPPDQKLQIFTLGRFKLVAKGRGIAIEKWDRKQAVILLKFLVAHLGRPVHREILSDLLWPEIEEKRAWKRLKVTIHFLRQQLRAAGIKDEVVETAGKTYLLKREAVWVDSVAFERCVAEGVVLKRRQQWEQALHNYEEAQHLYRSVYMEEDIYADWCATEREQLHEMYLEMLAGMADCHAANGHYAEAVLVCRTALIRDPCRESFHRTLMEYLVQLGRGDWAIDQYHRCCRLLADELGVDPMRETQNLYQQILEKFEGTSVEK